MAWEDPDAMGERRWVLVGMSERARLLAIVYAMPDERTVRVISARQATRQEAKQYA